MYKDFFAHNTTLMYTGLFGSIFTNLTVKRNVSKDSTEQQTIEVPVYNGASDTYINLKKEKNKNNNLYRDILPLIVFRFDGTMEYDPERQTNKNLKLRRPIPDYDNLTNAYQYNKVPYNFNYTLKIKAKNYTDLFQILEQIIVFFNPSVTLKVNNNTDIEDISDIDIVLNSIDLEDSYDGGSYNETRLLEYTLSFTLKGFLYKPTTIEKIVGVIDINYVNKDGNAIEGAGMEITKKSIDNQEIYQEILDTSYDVKNTTDILFSAANKYK